MKFLDKIITNIVKKQLNVINETVNNNKECKVKFRKYEKVDNKKTESHKDYLERTGISWLILGEFIAKTRKQSKPKMSQDKLAKKLGVSGSQLSRIENAQVKLTIDLANKIDEIFNTNISVLWDFPYIKSMREPEKEEDFSVFNGKTMPFGKFKDRLLQDVPQPYVDWLYKNGMFEKQINKELYEAFIKVGKL